VAARKPRRSAVTFATAREIVLRLPGVEETTSYGMPALRARKKLLARLHQDGEWLVVRCSLDARDALLRAKPKSFLVTDHYRAHPYVLVRLGAVSRSDLTGVLEQAWQECLGG
jgi:hypothetical protein